MNRNKIQTFSLTVAIIVSTFALYFPSLSFNLVSFDDPVFITHNPIIYNGFSWEAIRSAFTGRHGDGLMYVPILWVSYLLDVGLLGASSDTPWGFHFTNVLLHSLNAGLLFLILFAFCRHHGRALFGSALWALHPLRVESVAWVSERKDVLSGFFALLCVGCYVWAWLRKGAGKTDIPEPPQRPMRPLYWISFGFFVLGILSKPMLVTIPFLLVLLDLWPLRRAQLAIPSLSRATPRLVTEKWPFFTVSIIATAAVYLMQTHAIGDFSLPLRLYYIPANYWFYIQKTLAPIGLYPMVPRAALSISTFILLSGILVFVTHWVWSRREKQPHELIGWLTFLGLLVPVIGVVVIGRYPVADRYSYLPTIGVSIALLFALPNTSRPPWKQLLPRLRPLLAVGIVAILATLTARHLPSWKDDQHLFANVARHASGHYAAIHYQARVKIFTHGDFESADAMANQLLAQQPRDTHGLIIKLLSLSQLESTSAALEFALAHYPPRDIHANPGDYEYELATLAFFAGQYDVANRYMEKTLRLAIHDPKDQEQVHAIAMLLAHAQGDSQTALAHAHQIERLQHISVLQPADFLIAYVTLWSRAYYAQTVPLLLDLARTTPDRPDVLNNIVWMMATTAGSPADPVALIEIIETALRHAPDHPVLLNTLSVAQANAGDFSSAIHTARRVAERLSRSSDPDAPRLLRETEKRIDLFQQERPYRELAARRWLYAQ